MAALSPRQIKIVLQRKRLLRDYYRRQYWPIPKGFGLYAPRWGSVAHAMFERAYRKEYKTSRVGAWNAAFTARLERRITTNRVRAMRLAQEEERKGVRETRLNGGGRIDVYKMETLGFTDAAPWCADFVNWLYKTVGDPLTFNNPRYCPNYVTAARLQRDRLVEVKENAQPGDLVLFDWAGDGVADHIGIVTTSILGLVRVIAGPIATVEGNTGADPNDPSGGGFGDGVHKRWRRKSQVLMIARRLDAGERP